MKLGEHVPIPQWLIPLVFLAASVAAAAEVYVSPSGNDANPGTKERPLATVQHALEASRARPGPNKILIKPGTYYLSRPLDLDPRDSGLTVEGQGQGVVVSGGRRITGWTPWKGRILQADLSTLGLANLDFHELYYRTKLQAWARVPNSDPGHPPPAASCKTPASWNPTPRPGSVIGRVICIRSDGRTRSGRGSCSTTP